MRPGSSSAVVVDLVALMICEGLQGADREAGVEGQQHPGRQQGVAAEQGHEPGHAGGDHRALWMLGIEDTQRAEVVHAAAQHRREVGVGGADLWAAASPFLEPAGGLGVFDRVAARVSERHRGRVDRRDRFDHGGPLVAGGQGELPAQRASILVWVGVAADENALFVVTASAGDLQRVAGDLGGDVDSRVGSSVLHLEQVGEVCGDGQRHDAVHLGLADVANREVFTHSVADVAAAYDH